MKITKNITNFLVKSSNRILKKDGKDFDKLSYGMEILVINISKLLILYSIALIFHIVLQVLLFNIVFGSVRKYAYGLHANNSISCTLTTCSVFIGSVFLSDFISKQPWINYHFANLFLLILFIFPFILLFLYAPSDTEKRPLKNALMRSNLKIKTLITVFILFIITLLIPVTYSKYKYIIFLAIFFESITTTPILYKLQKRRYKNYEFINKKPTK